MSGASGAGCAPHTRQGGHHQESPKRRAAATKAIAAMGGELVRSYLTLGRYDGVVIFDAPDDHTAAKIALKSIPSARARRGFAKVGRASPSAQKLRFQG